jgi:hypothetical protein
MVSLFTTVSSIYLERELESTETKMSTDAKMAEIEELYWTTAGHFKLYNY